MAEEKGTACILKVGDAASPEVFTTLEGQTDTSFDGSTTVADTTAKDNAGWETGTSATISGVVSCSGTLRTTRAQLDLLETAWRTRVTKNCQIVFDAAGKGYSGAFFVTQFNIQAPTQDVVRYQITLTPDAALTALP